MEIGRPRPNVRFQNLIRIFELPKCTKLRLHFFCFIYVITGQCHFGKERFTLEELVVDTSLKPRWLKIVVKICLTKPLFMLANADGSIVCNYKQTCHHIVYNYTEVTSPEDTHYTQRTIEALNSRKQAHRDIRQIENWEIPLAVDDKKVECLSKVEQHINALKVTIRDCFGLKHQLDQINMEIPVNKPPYTTLQTNMDNLLKQIPMAIGYEFSNVTSKCPICLDQMTHSACLDRCGHVYCRGCIELLPIKGRARVACPTCKREGKIVNLFFG